jgi:hypothetical protein
MSFFGELKRRNVIHGRADLARHGWWRRLPTVLPAFDVPAFRALPAYCCGRFPL